MEQKSKLFSRKNLVSAFMALILGGVLFGASWLKHSADNLDLIEHNERKVTMFEDSLIHYKNKDLNHQRIIEELVLNNSKDSLALAQVISGVEIHSTIKDDTIYVLREKLRATKVELAQARLELSQSESRNRRMIQLLKQRISLLEKDSAHLSQTIELERSNFAQERRRFKMNVNHYIQSALKHDSLYVKSQGFLKKRKKDIAEIAVNYYRKAESAGITTYSSRRKELEEDINSR